MGAGWMLCGKWGGWGAGWMHNSCHDEDNMPVGCTTSVTKWPALAMSLHLRHVKKLHRQRDTCCRC
eukprot:11300525-Prorocentrum_lima.AAC.1